uniref:Protein DCL, chloroplastic n=1 Tax=Anthurium amnicola TaxID=1678845 RepID=A0A1D1XMK7_9ARAE
MAVSSMPSSASREIHRHRGGPQLPSTGPSPCASSSLLAFPPLPLPAARFLGLRAAVKGGSQDPALLRRPLVSPPPDDDDEGGEEEEEEEEEEGSSGGVPEGDEGDEGGEDGRSADESRGDYRSRRREPGWVDWEDQVLEDTVPLVSFVRMLLHSGRYGSGDRLSAEHEKTVLERLLPYHPEFEKKIGCGVDFITIGFHPDFENSRCLFIVRKDGELIDFSYWKCIKGLIRKKFPLYADSFILRHFRRRRHNDE